MNVPLPPGSKVCFRCQKSKPNTDYSPDNRRKTGLQAACRDCQNAKAQAAHLANPKQRRAYDHDRYPKRRHTVIAQIRFKRTGWTQEMFNIAWDAQKGLCAICKQPMLRDVVGHLKASADHCHKTKQPRALLHGRCNVGMGFFQDDPVLLRAAADYIDRHAKLIPLM